jgi:hypothetical protein
LARTLEITRTEVADMDIRTPNRAALIRLYQWAKAEDAKRQAGEPSEWDQVEWIGYRLDSDGNHCGTVCCLAGKAVVDAGAVPYGNGEWELHAMTVCFGAVVLDGRTVARVPDLAAEILGLTAAWADLLFFGSLTLDGVRSVMNEILGEDVESLAAPD